MTGTVHDCVPLGWNPVRVDDGFFYVGYSAELDETYWFVSPPWAAGFGPHEPVDPAGRTARDVLAHLEAAGMVDETRRRWGVKFNLSGAGFERFFDHDNFGNNRLDFPYICYSTIAAKAIIWKQPVRLESDPYGPGRVQTFRVAFTWTISTDSSWRPDAFIRAHSIVLGPTRSPAIAKFVRRGDDWVLDNLYPGSSDRVTEPAAWPTDPPSKSS